ncbi:MULTISPECIES: MTAP family purine nucleoside phosphorylase [Cryobacterium]|uniref:S-methyl-5'-thioadenosine phosphorylase n=1 Tax=Cryobacterium shii TaxID=1259235 RepID=A0AAQ2C6E1_9MICO|nr:MULTISPECIES: MTAP family purine nucleoside phosphorylase [Cryobacterium]TFC48269.1 5'-methylthioadenosine phosphorylase [Cryobacterium shii]TFD16646.1 5'-methylthioadenosine phosphorylase [Cryobacterium sp. TMT4-10]
MTESSTPSRPPSVDEVRVAVIGGSGLYRLFDAGTVVSVDIDTPYGPTSSSITIGERAGRRVAFLPRHGGDHSVAPHLINYRANIWALASLGVTAIISSSAVGGVSPEYPPGLLVVTDQFIDRTTGRADTFYDRGTVAHLAAADPFDPELRRFAIAALTAQDEDFAPTGTVVVIQGPRFSTRAESLWFRAAGAHTVNMTQYPEVVLAAELNIGMVNLSFVTDADAGLAPAADDPGAADPDAVSAGLVFTRLRAAQPRILAAIDGILRALPQEFAPRELIAPEHVRAVLDRRPGSAADLPASTDASVPVVPDAVVPVVPVSAVPVSAVPVSAVPAGVAE